MPPSRRKKGLRNQRSDRTYLNVHHFNISQQSACFQQQRRIYNYQPQQMQKNQAAENLLTLKASGKDYRPPVLAGSTLKPPLMTSLKSRHQRKMSLRGSDSYFDNQMMMTLRLDTFQKQPVCQDEVLSVVSFDCQNEDRLKDLTGILKEMDEIQRKSQEVNKDISSFDQNLNQYKSQQNIAALGKNASSDQQPIAINTKLHVNVLPAKQDQEISFSQNISTIRSNQIPQLQQNRNVSRSKIVAVLEMIRETKVRNQGIKSQLLEKFADYQVATKAVLQAISVQAEQWGRQIQLKLKQEHKHEGMQNSKLRIELQATEKQLQRVKSQLAATQQRCNQVTQDLDTACSARRSDKKRQKQLKRKIKALQKEARQLHLLNIELKTKLEDQSALFETSNEEPHLQRQAQIKDGVQSTEFMTIRVNSPKDTKLIKSAQNVLEKGSGVPVNQPAPYRFNIEKEASIEELIDKNKRLECKVAELEVETSAFVAKMKHLKEALAQKDLEVVRVEEELLRAKGRLREINDMHEEAGGRERHWALQMRVQRERSEQQSMQLEKQGLELKREQVKMKGLLKDSQEQLRQCQQCIKRLNSEIQQERREKQQIGQAMASIEHQSNAKLEEYDRYLTQIEEMMGEVSIKNKQREREIEERESQVRASRLQINKKLAEIAMRQQKVQAMEDDYEQKILMLQRREEGMKAEYSMAINAQHATRDRWYQRYYQVLSPSKSPSTINDRQIRPTKLRPSPVTSSGALRSPNKDFLASQKEWGAHSKQSSWRGRNQLVKHRSQGNIFSGGQMRSHSPRTSRQVPSDMLGLNNRITRLRQVLNRELCDVGGGGAFTPY